MKQKDLIEYMNSELKNYFFKCIFKSYSIKYKGTCLFKLEGLYHIGESIGYGREYYTHVFPMLKIYIDKTTIGTNKIEWFYFYNANETKKIKRKSKLKDIVNDIIYVIIDKKIDKNYLSEYKEAYIENIKKYKHKTTPHLYNENDVVIFKDIFKEKRQGVIIDIYKKISLEEANMYVISCDVSGMIYDIHESSVITKI